MECLKLNFLLSSFGIGLKSSIFDILCFIIALFFLRRVLKFIDLYLSRQAGKFVSFSLSVLKFGVVLGGGYLPGEDVRGGGGGGRAVKDSIKDLSRLFFPLIFDGVPFLLSMVGIGGGEGYLSGEDGRS